MINKEKLEIIDKKLDELYEMLDKISYDDADILYSNEMNETAQAIYNLESTKLLLEPIENNLGLPEEKEDYCFFDDENYTAVETEINEKNPETSIYVCPKCNKRVEVYGTFVSGWCHKCNKKLVKEED